MLDEGYDVDVLRRSVAEARREQTTAPDNHEVDLASPRAELLAKWENTGPSTFREMSDIPLRMLVIAAADV